MMDLLTARAVILFSPSLFARGRRWRVLAPDEGQPHGQRLRVHLVPRVRSKRLPLTWRCFLALWRSGDILSPRNEARGEEGARHAG